MLSLVFVSHRRRLICSDLQRQVGQTQSAVGFIGAMTLRASGSTLHAQESRQGPKSAQHFPSSSQTTLRYINFSFYNCGMCIKRHICQLKVNCWLTFSSPLGAQYKIAQRFMTSLKGFIVCSWAGLGTAQSTAVWISDRLAFIFLSIATWDRLPRKRQYEGKTIDL